MTVADESSSYETCVGALDRVANRLRSRDISPEQYEAEALAALSTYLDDDRPDDDLGLLLQYARLPIEEQGSDPIDGDRAAIDSFDRQLQALLHMPESRANLESTLDSIRERIGSGDGTGIEDLTALCSNGWRDHPHFFMFRDNIVETLRTAFELGAVEALHEAVRPTRPDPGPLASTAVFGGSMFHYAFDLLATLATHDDDTAERAIDALVELTGYLETAGPAAVRLPVWRLDPAHRSLLLEHLESIVDLVEADPFLIPTPDANRIPHVLRSVLWLANDAGHL